MSSSSSASKRRRVGPSSAETAEAAELAEKKAVLNRHRAGFFEKTKPNLTDCRYQGLTKGKCPGRVCCPTGTKAAGKCRRSAAECGYAGIHPSQVTVRVRRLTKTELAAIKDGLITHEDIHAHLWKVDHIAKLREGKAAFEAAYPDVAQQRRVRQLHFALKRDENDAAVQRRVARVAGRTELNLRHKAARVERRLDADMRVDDKLRKRLSR